MKTLIATIACLLLASQAQAHGHQRAAVLLADAGCVPVAPPQHLLFVPQPSSFLSIQTQSVYSQSFLSPAPLYGVGGCGSGLRIGVGSYGYGLGVRDFDRLRVRTPGFSLRIR